MPRYHHLISYDADRPLTDDEIVRAEMLLAVQIDEPQTWDCEDADYSTSNRKITSFKS